MTTSATLNTLNALNPLALRPMVLRIEKASFQVRIGVTDQERARSQEVSLAVALRFSEVSEACTSDRLEDTVCYAELIAAAERQCTQQPYRLLEAMCHDVFVSLRRELRPSVELWVRLTKVSPPVPSLRAGVSVALGDWTPTD
jgi:dihydroneopterin aldolase